MTIEKARPKRLDWDEIIYEYEHSEMELRDFVIYYTFNWHEAHGQMDNKESKADMFEELIEELTIRIAERPVSHISKIRYQ